MQSINFLKQNGVDIDKSLEIFGNIESYNDTIGEFLISIKDKIEKLKLYKDNKDMKNYAIYAHALKSDARSFGFVNLEKRALEHEMRSKNNDIFYIIQDYPELEKIVNQSSQLVKEYISSSSENTTTTNDINLEYKNKTILVVDDSNIIRNFVKRIFKDEYNIGAAQDGGEAINIISANKDNDNIVAMLLDLNMPKVDGFKVLDYMQENNLFEKIPVSIISGDSTKETIDKAFTYKIIDMLSKPFNNSDVKRVVEKTILYQQMQNTNNH